MTESLTWLVARDYSNPNLSHETDKWRITFPGLAYDGIDDLKLVVVGRAPNCHSLSVQISLEFKKALRRGRTDKTKTKINS